MPLSAAKLCQLCLVRIVQCSAADVSRLQAGLVSLHERLAAVQVLRVTHTVSRGCRGGTVFSVWQFDQGRQPCWMCCMNKDIAHGPVRVRRVVRLFC